MLNNKDNELLGHWPIKVKTKNGEFIEEEERENDDDLIIMKKDKEKVKIKVRGAKPKNG